MFSESLTILGFNNNGSNSAQELSPNEESNDSSGDFSANKLCTNKKMAQHVAFGVHMAPEEAFEQSHVQQTKKYPANVLKISIIEITSQFFVCFINLTTLCALQVIAFWIQAVGFLQLSCSSLRPAGKHSCGKASQNENCVFPF